MTAAQSEALAQLLQQSARTCTESEVRKHGSTDWRSLPACLPDFACDGCFTSQALRWLRARGFSVPKALALQDSCDTWWSNHRPRLIATRSAVRLHTLERHLVAWTPVLCSSGRAVVAVDCARHRIGDVTALPVFFLCLDHAIQHSPGGELTVLFDVRGFGRANMDTRLALSMVKCLNAGYPERLGCAYILGAPRVFVALWRIVRVALDARTRSKVCFVPTPELLAAVVGAHAVPTWMGGANSGLDEHLHAFAAGEHKYMEVD